ncbi:MAG: hypothetical protein MJZ84_03325 [Paludibacteraceae bacterium]|nr:hypothetical protein [Paludibacteraceae bacterium]
MSKFKAAEPYSDISGKVHGKRSNISACVNRITGKQHTYYWNPDNVVVQTPARVLQHVVIYKANKRATIILSDPENVRLYKQKNKTERGIASGSPRGYVLSILIKEIKPPLQEELATKGTIDGKTPEQWLDIFNPRSAFNRHKLP